MKRFILTLIFVATLSFLFFAWSGNLFDKMVDFVHISEKSKTLSNVNTQIQRSMVNTSLALSTGEEAFFGQALKTLEASLEDLKQVSLKQDDDIEKAISHVTAIEFEVKELQEKSLRSEKIKKKEILDLNWKVEKFGESIQDVVQKNWSREVKGFGLLVESYETVNIIGKVLQVFSILIFLYLAYSLYSRNKAEEESKHKDKVHSLLFSSLSEAVFLCDATGKIKACNFSCSLLTRLDLRQLMGTSIQDHFPQTNFPQNDQKAVTFIGLIGSGQSHNGLIMQSKKSGDTHWYSLNTQPILEEGKDNHFSMIISFSDITDKILAQRKIQSQQSQLVESAKLQSIGEMASGIAHEINNPLAIISSTTELLSLKADRKDVLESSVVKKTTEKVMNTLDRMTKIVSSLLSLSRGDAEVHDSVDVRQVIEVAVDFYSIYLEKENISFSMEGFENSIEIDCHATQISQVLLNLLKNAADAIRDLDEKWVQLKLKDIGEHVRLEVIDSGKGIPLEMREKILQPFFTTKAIGKGTGLGLSISKTIIQAHQGELGIDSHNKNTCFYIELPKKQKIKDFPEDDFKEAA